MIEQFVASNPAKSLILSVISLSLFPSLISDVERPQSQLSSMLSLASARSDETAAPPSFSRRLAAVLADEFHYLLQWDLPISTVVHFNETGESNMLTRLTAGKATHIRDVVDIRDVAETFVPFAKRLGWITRRLTGLVSSTMGSIALAMIPTTVSPVSAKPKSRSDLKIREGPIALGHEMPGPASAPHVRKRNNTLGLEGMSVSSAPDCTFVI